MCGLIWSLLLLSLGQIVSYGLKGPLTGRGQSLSTSFAADVQDCLVKIDVGDVQSDQLADPHAGGIHNLEHGQIAQPQEGGSVGGLEKGLDLVLFEELGQTFILLRSSDDGNGTGLQVSPADQEFVEGSQGGELSSGSGPAVVFVVEHNKKLPDGVGGNSQYFGSDLQGQSGTGSIVCFK